MFIKMSFVSAFIKVVLYICEYVNIVKWICSCSFLHFLHKKYTSFVRRSYCTQQFYIYVCVCVCVCIARLFKIYLFQKIFVLGLKCLARSAKIRPYSHICDRERMVCTCVHLLEIKKQDSAEVSLFCHFCRCCGTSLSCQWR